MANIIVEAFKNEEEMTASVRDLERKGYRPENIILFTGSNKPEKLENQTDIQIEEASSDHERNESFMDKMKKAFMQDVGPEDNLSTADKLVSYGLTKEQAEKYSKNLADGDMVIIANETGSDSGRRTAPVADDNIDSLDRTGRTNLADDDLESTSSYQNITARETAPFDGQQDKQQSEAESRNKEEEVLEENPVLNKASKERKGRSI